MKAPAGQPVEKRETVGANESDFNKSHFVNTRRVTGELEVRNVCNNSYSTLITHV